MPSHHHRSSARVNKAHSKKKKLGHKVNEKKTSSSIVRKVDSKWQRKVDSRNKKIARKINSWDVKNNKIANWILKNDSVWLEDDINNLTFIPRVNAPKTIALVAMHDLWNPYLLKRKCLAVCGLADWEVDGKIEWYKPTTVLLPAWAQPSFASNSSSSNKKTKKHDTTSSDVTTSTSNKHQRLTFIDVLSRDKFQILDVCKAADIVVCCFGPYCELYKFVLNSLVDL